MPFDSDNDVHSRKVKESNLRLSDIVLENKHEYARHVRRKIAAVKNFDLQPEAFRKKAKSRLPALLQQVKGEHLCVSLLLTSSYRMNLQINHDHGLPSTTQLKALHLTVWCCASYNQRLSPLQP